MQFYKKRIGIQNRGKSRGVRTLVVFKQGDKIFFVYGFAKNQQANLSDEELKWLKRLAKELLNYNDVALTKAIEAGELLEVSR